MKITTLCAAILLVLATAASAQTFRDASGRLTGTATRDANGTTTFRDGAGRMTGTASTDANGTTTFRDGSGRMIGTGQPTTCAIAQFCMDSNGKWESWK